METIFYLVIYSFVGLLLLCIIYIILLSALYVSLYARRSYDRIIKNHKNHYFRNRSTCWKKTVD